MHYLDVVYGPISMKYAFFRCILFQLNMHYLDVLYVNEICVI